MVDNDQEAIMKVMRARKTVACEYPFLSSVIITEVGDEK